MWCLAWHWKISLKTCSSYLNLDQYRALILPLWSSRAALYDFLLNPLRLDKVIDQDLQILSECLKCFTSIKNAHFDLRRSFH